MRGRRRNEILPAMNEPFVRGDDTPWQNASDVGVRRKILGHGPDLMLVRVEFDAGAVAALHHHPHRQVCYVAAGRFEVTIDGQHAELTAGDSFYVTAEKVHGVVAREAGTLIDAFTPARLDFLP